jgi:beta-glucosidase/6-phospho-beta-glucosidase/beta-galactosidase
MIAATQHDRCAAEDFALVRSVGIRTVRESVRWHLVDRSGHYDFASLAPIAAAARAAGVQVIWSLCHYGWPDDLDLFSPAWVDRFAAYAEAVARYLRANSDEPLVFAPINEISFFAWACGTAGWFYPFATGRGDDVKRQLVRAAIAGSDAIWRVDTRARLVQIDPLSHVVAPRDNPQAAAAAAVYDRAQFAAWNMLAGRREPELGGHPRYLDIVGANFYHDNQWEHGGERLRWEDEPRDPRWVPLHQLLARLHARYGRPLFLAETSHVGSSRARWLREIVAEVRRALASGVPVAGVCLYPIIDRPDWHDPDHWHHSGLWDLVPGESGRLRRVLVPDYAAELARARRLLPDPAPARLSVP